MSIKTVQQIKSTRDNPQFQFPQKMILSIVEEVQSERLSRKDACIKYGMAYGTMNAWLRRYGKPTKKASVSLQKKREIVRAIKEGRMSIKEAQIATGVKDAHSIRTWIRKSDKQSADLAGLNNPSMPSEINKAPGADKELEDAKLKIAALETMIDIAEEQFKISIRKNSGAKQLEK
jgi:transposase-like protein